MKRKFIVLLIIAILTLGIIACPKTEDVLDALKKATPKTSVSIIPSKQDIADFTAEIQKKNPDINKVKNMLARHFSDEHKNQLIPSFFSNGKKPLYTAVEHKNGELAKILYKSGANIFAENQDKDKNDNGETPVKLIIDMYQGDNDADKQLASDLISYAVSIKNHNEHNVMHKAAKHGDKILMEALINVFNGDPKIKDFSKYRMTPILWASKENLATFTVLWNALDKEGREVKEETTNKNILHHVAYYGDKDISKFMADEYENENEENKKFDANMKDIDGNTPLHYIAMNADNPPDDKKNKEKQIEDYIAVARNIKGMGGDVSVRNDKEKTPLEVYNDKGGKNNILKKELTPEKD